MYVSYVCAYDSCVCMYVCMYTHTHTHRASGPSMPLTVSGTLSAATTTPYIRSANIYTYIYIYIHTHTHTHINIHTYTQPQDPPCHWPSAALSLLQPQLPRKHLHTEEFRAKIPPHHQHTQCSIRLCLLRILPRSTRQRARFPPILEGTLCSIRLCNRHIWRGGMRTCPSREGCIRLCGRLRRLCSCMYAYTYVCVAMIVHVCMYVCMHSSVRQIEASM